MQKDIEEDCNGKNKYSKHEARRIRILRTKSGASNLRVYECPKCFTWHLTSTQRFDYPPEKEKNKLSVYTKKNRNYIFEE